LRHACTYFHCSCAVSVCYALLGAPCAAACLHVTAFFTRHWYFYAAMPLLDGVCCRPTHPAATLRSPACLLAAVAIYTFPSAGDRYLCARKTLYPFYACKRRNTQLSSCRVPAPPCLRVHANRQALPLCCHSSFSAAGGLRLDCHTHLLHLPSTSLGRMGFGGVGDA